MLAIILAGVVLGGTAMFLASNRPERRRVGVETEDRKHHRRR